MQRWHRERALMLRRWKMEMEKHGYDWRNPPSDPNACHCAKGIGSVRKNRPHDCGNPRCVTCHWEKFYVLKDRYNERRRAIEWELKS